MLIEVDFNSDEAIYIQLCNQIILGIAMSDIQEGDSLPSVRQLADTVGVNMHTVNKAYHVLKREGYISLDKRRGAVIAVDVLYAGETDPEKDAWLADAAVISTGTDGEAACRAVLWAARCCMAAMRDAVPWTGAEAGADVVGADAPLRVNAI